ncbi:DUF397 domain-containing protein [Amycolatopsis anabasis]|uniref:DUF397 domain-containing protein n=1 Tax=Amycolatopsis anabasis TaxID=1840409 RepID=UPI00131C42CA|nr:DUF397 domain-containing protein [Amycolatopsis anabasis]
MTANSPAWRKSSRSPNGGSCVEMGRQGRRVLVRDTKHRAGGILDFSVEAWRAFVRDTVPPKAGPFE